MYILCIKSLMSYKTPTCLLLNNKQEIDSFGYQAEEKYADLCMNKENGSYYYYRRFKMRLQEGEVIRCFTALICSHTELFRVDPATVYSQLYTFLIKPPSSLCCYPIHVFMF